MSTTAMSGYESAAWHALMEEATRVPRPGRLDRLGRQVTARAGQAAASARAAAGRLPGADTAIDTTGAAFASAMTGLRSALTERGLNSVTPADVFAAFPPAAGPITGYADLRRLDLGVCDAAVPARRQRYLVLAATAGAVSSLATSTSAVTGALTGGASLSVAAAAIVADVTTVLVGMGRIVALVGAHYGYDVREPAEQVFATGVLAYAGADSPAETAATLAALARLTGQLSGDAEPGLSARQRVDVVQTMASSLGLRLVKRKLAQAVPLIGAAVNGGINVRLAQLTFERAQRVYRLRFLTDKYALDPRDWTPDGAGAEVAVALVDEVLDAELASGPEQR